MDITDYRKLQHRIRLTVDGQTPSIQLTSFEDQEAALARVDRSWHLVERFPFNEARADSQKIAHGNETWIALKRWFLSHHLFIPEVALTGYCLNEVVRAQSNGEPDQAHYWMDLAVSLRKGCAGLFLYGMDFTPCAGIYDSAIRSNMPEAFSGFWIRERQNGLLPAMNAFSSNCSTAASNQLAHSLRSQWAAAEKRYHELHVQSIYMAVPNGRSKARDYKDLTGKMHEMNDPEFDCFDSWFCIDRSPMVTRLDYVFQVCDVIERLVADLASGHRLECVVAKDLLNGAKAAMVVFGQWAGPVSERSAFYPKCLRGE